MKTSKNILLAAALAAFALLAAGVFMQLVKNILPCPLCILQRYAFVAVALICLIAAFLPPTAMRMGAGLGMVAALAGAGVAIRNVWVIMHPGVSCGIDPLETSLNKIFPAELMPWLFKAEGLCTTEYAPILGLSIPQWSLVWFVFFTLVLGWVAFKRAR